MKNGRPEELRHLVLMNDYCCGMPLWSRGGLVSNPVAELGISAELSQQLLAWQEFFDAHVDPLSGWDLPANATRHRKHGRYLHRMLEAELPDCEIRSDYRP